MHRLALLLASSILVCVATAGAQVAGGAHRGGAALGVAPATAAFDQRGFCCGPGTHRPFGALHRRHLGRVPPLIFVSSYDDYFPLEDEVSRVVVLDKLGHPANGVDRPAPVGSAQQDFQNSPGAKLVEIPAAVTYREGAAASQTTLPTVFLLAGGQRIEAQRYTITREYVYIMTGRHEGRRILVDDLNVEATVAANRRNGIDLRIPSTRNELFLSY